MCAYQRWHHSNGGVGEFQACREFIKLVEDGMGKRKASPHGVILAIEVVCAPQYNTYTYGGGPFWDGRW